MKQVIFLGFYCKIYKKNPIAQIYIGDYLADEIEIPEYYTEEFIKNNKLCWNNNLHQINQDNNMPNPKFKSLISKRELNPQMRGNFMLHRLSPEHVPGSLYYELNQSKSFKDYCLKNKDNLSKKNFKYPKIFVLIIDDEQLKFSNGLLKIKFKNSDSNYSNVFMSESTLLMLDIFYIFPYIMLENVYEYTQRSIDLFSRKTTSISIEGIFKHFKGERVNWPMNQENHFKLIDEQGNKTIPYIIGGNCELQVELKKKYNIWWAKDFKTKGYRFINLDFIKNFIVPLHDKYQQQKKS